jgi:hypothetical protein
MTPTKPVHLKPGQVVPACDVKFVEREHRSKYDALVAQVRGLTVGKALLLDVPAGDNGRAFMNRIGAGMAWHKIKAPMGHKLIKRLTEKGQVALMFVRTK